MHSTSHDNLVLTINEFCASARISRRTFYNLLRDEAAPPTIKIGSRHMIRRQAAEDWLRQLESLAA